MSPPNQGSTMRELNSRIEDGIESIFNRNIARANQVDWKNKRAPHHHRTPSSDHVLPTEIDIFTAGVLDACPSLLPDQRGNLQSRSLLLAAKGIKVRGALSKEERMMALHILQAVVVYQRDFCRAYLQAHFPQDVRRHILHARHSPHHRLGNGQVETVRGLRVREPSEKTFAVTRVGITRELTLFICRV